jgi:hypothetical protein
MSHFSKTFAMAAAFGLAFAPIAAQAGTRAASAPVSVDASRVSAPGSEANELGGVFNPLWLILLLAAIAAAAGLASGGGNGRSRG